MRRGDSSATRRTITEVLALVQVLRHTFAELAYQRRAPAVSVRVDSLWHEAALVQALDENDLIFPAYGALATALAAGVTPFEVLTGVLGIPADRTSAGRSYPGSWADRRLGLVARSPIVNAHIPQAVGAALGLRLRGSRKLVACHLDAPWTGHALLWAHELALPLVVLDCLTTQITATAPETVRDLAEIIDDVRLNGGPAIVPVHEVTVDVLPSMPAIVADVREARDLALRVTDPSNPGPDASPARYGRTPVISNHDCSYRDALRETLSHALATDQTVVVLGQNARNGGDFGVTADLAPTFGESRVLDAPLPANELVGLAIGLCLQGFRPVVELPIADLSLDAVSVLRNEAARWHYRSGGNEHLPLVVRIPWGAGVRGGLYGSQAVEALYAHIPGLSVVAPSTPNDAAHLLAASIAHPHPVVFLEHKKLYESVRGSVDQTEVMIGEAAIARVGTQATLITYGVHRHLAMKAAQSLAQEGIDIEVIDVRTIAPLDHRTFLASAKKCGRVLIVHEDHHSFGVGAEIAARLAGDAFFDLDAPIRRLCGSDDVPAMPYAYDAERAVTITTDRIIEAIHSLLAI